MGINLLAALALAGALLTPLASTPLPAAAAGCEYTLGFKTLHDLIPTVVGNCQDNAQYDANGNASQKTTLGRLVWRKATNATYFQRDGHLWVNGPTGVQERAAGRGANGVHGNPHHPKKAHPAHGHGNGHGHGNAGQQHGKGHGLRF
ncbi:MAG TPA: hypothetical protein VNL16_07175 [Chloroflexota bacterium]|nr:hypothetical protein [Chloroflexota bacterium]